MGPNPLHLALNEIRETRMLLEQLIVSSEQFDYPRAKAALRRLDRKARTLARLERKWSAPPAGRNIVPVRFGPAEPGRTRRRS